MKKITLTAFLLIASFSLFAQDKIDVLFYNLLEFPSANPSNRMDILKDILNEFEPDIFMVAELESDEASQDILDVCLNDDGDRFSRAEFIPNQSGGNEIQQSIFYNKNLFWLEGVDVIQTDIRDINHFHFKLKTENSSSNPIYLEMYVAHLKSSQGGTNENIRLGMVNEFTTSLEELDPNSYVVFAGDLNLYDADEPAYQELLDPTNAIVLKDPIDRPGDWNNNINFQDVHTQSTRISSSGFGAGAGGGMDDRFDFILLSENMFNNPEMEYVTDTYAALGNNGNCFDDRINNPECSGEYSQAFRTLLYNMSDHMPVALQLQTNENFILNGTDFVVQQPKILLKETVANNAITLQVPENLINTLSFEVYNVLGQKMYESGTVTSKEVSIDISNYSEGIYYIRTNLPQQEHLKFLKSF